MSESMLVDPGRDLVILLQACSAHLNDDVLSRVRAEVGDDIRIRDGYVFQHLVVGQCSISELARRLGVTQQAASKQVADLLRRRLIVRQRDSNDARAWQVSLSARGHRAVESARRARLAVLDDLAAGLGASRLEVLIDNLAQLSDHTGAMGHLLDRELRPEESR